MQTLCLSCVHDVKQKNLRFSKLFQMDVLVLRNPRTRMIPHTQDTHELHFEALAPCLVCIVIFNPQEHDLNLRICENVYGIKEEIEQIRILTSCYHNICLQIESNRNTEVWLNDHFLQFRPI